MKKKKKKNKLCEPLTLEQVSSIVQQLQGSGLNYEFWWTESRTYFHLHTFFDFMNDVGYYDGVIPVHMFIRKDAKILERSYVRCKNTGKYFGIRDYLEDSLYMVLRKGVTDCYETASA